MQLEQVSRQHQQPQQLPEPQKLVAQPPQSPRRRKRTFEYVGVHLNKSGLWAAQFRKGGNTVQVDSYNDEEDAARAWDVVARIHRGAKAHGGRFGTVVGRLNFPTQEEEEAAASAGGGQLAAQVHG